MNLPTSLHITPKGEDEIKRRVYKLDMKKRSLLILLGRPQSIEYLASKTVLLQDEFNATIIALIQEGFVATGGAAANPAPTDLAIHIDDEVVLSEAKFLLTNFCVDSFGTDSQIFVDTIRSCKSVNDVRHHLNTILTVAEKRCPAQMPTLYNVIREINATA